MTAVRNTCWFVARAGSKRSWHWVNPNEHAGIGKKNPTGDPVGFLIWWSWRDLNPRPQAFFEQFYMCSRLV